jgi:antitoxin ParD1/3/4
LNVSIGESLEDFVREKVTHGDYSSESEVVQESLRLMQRQEAWKAEISAKIEEGMASVRAGRTVPSEEAWAILRARRDEVLHAQAKVQA